MFERRGSEIVYLEWVILKGHIERWLARSMYFTEIKLADDMSSPFTYIIEMRIDWYKSFVLS
jgi:hypothetical protein